MKFDLQSFLILRPQDVKQIIQNVYNERRKQNHLFGDPQIDEKGNFVFELKKWDKDEQCA